LFADYLIFRRRCCHCLFFFFAFIDTPFRLFAAFALYASRQLSIFFAAASACRFLLMSYASMPMPPLRRSSRHFSPMLSSIFFQRFLRLMLFVEMILPTAFS